MSSRHNVHRRENNKFFYLYRGVEYDVEGLHALVPGIALVSLRKRLNNRKWTVADAVERPTIPGLRIDHPTYLVGTARYTLSQLHRLFKMSCGLTWLKQKLDEKSDRYAIRELAERYGRGDERDGFVATVDAEIQATLKKPERLRRVK